MSSEENQGRVHDVRERIVNLMHAIGQAAPKQVPGEELQRLKSAASRLDEMLKAAADANTQELKNAAARLDHLLSDIRKGKDVIANLKKRRESQKKDE